MAVAAGHEALLQGVFSEFVQPILLVFFVVAIVVFLWGLVELIRDADSSDARSKGRQHIIWGLIGMMIMASAFGIIEVVEQTVPGSQGSSFDLFR